MKEDIIELNEENFDEEVIRADVPVIVDFWAPWCVPCKMIAPAVEKISAAYKGTCKVGKLNIDDSGAVATRFDVMNIPTLLLFKDGQQVDRLVGVVSQADIERLLSEVMV